MATAVPAPSGGPSIVEVSPHGRTSGSRATSRCARRRDCRGQRRPLLRPRPAPTLDHRPGHDHRCDRRYALGFSALGLSIAEAVRDHREEQAGGEPREHCARRLGIVAAGRVASSAACLTTQRLPVAGHRTVGCARGDGRGGGRATRAGPRPHPRPRGRSRRALHQHPDRRGAGARRRATVACATRARTHGEGRPAERKAVAVERNPKQVGRSVAIGRAVAGGLMALAGVQFGIAEVTPILVSSCIGPPGQPGDAAGRHVAAATLLAVTAASCSTGPLARDARRRHR